MWIDRELRQTGRTERMLIAAADCAANGYQLVIVAADMHHQAGLQDRFRETLARRLSASGDDPDTAFRRAWNLVYWITIRERTQAFREWPRIGKYEPFVFIDHHAQELIARDWYTKGGAR